MSKRSKSDSEGETKGERECIVIFVIKLGWEFDRHEGQTVRDLGRKRRQEGRQNREIVSGMKK